MDKTHITIHHTADYAENDVAEQFDSVNEAHRIRWNGATKSAMGYYGGYHYIIERNGTVQQFRNDWEVGAHNDKGIVWKGAKRVSANYYALGVCFAGNMSRQHLTDAQIESGVRLIQELQNKYDIPNANVLPHRFYKSTQCPGNNIADNAWEFILEAKMKLGDKEPAIVKWHKKNKIIEKWNTPYTEEEMKLAWSIYKALKASNEGKIKFTL